MCDSFICVTHSYVWLIHMCDSFICVTHSYVWLIHMCDSFIWVTHSYVWLIHMCDSFICVTHSYVWLIHMWCDSHRHTQHLWKTPTWRRTALLKSMWCRLGGRSVMSSAPRLFKGAHTLRAHCNTHCKTLQDTATHGHRRCRAHQDHSEVLTHC